MARLKFEMFLDDLCKNERGICTTFTDGKGRKSTTWWSSPPNNIDHVDITYLQGRFDNVRTDRHAVFIKEQFKTQIKLFDEYQENRFKKIS